VQYFSLLEVIIDSMISVIIPVISDKFLKPLLDILVVGKLSPHEIIIIDNNNQCCKDICKEYPVSYFPQEKNLGVNASWNLGVSLAKMNLVAILNDDLIVPKSFLSLVVQTFKIKPDAGIVVPQTVQVIKQVYKQTNHKGPILQPLTRREGWAFTIKKEAYKMIPSELFTFYGDDWLFKHMLKAGFKGYKITNCLIYHYIGLSNTGKEQMHSEGKIYKKMGP